MKIISFKGQGYQLCESEFDCEKQSQHGLSVRGSVCMFRIYDKDKELAKDFDEEDKITVLYKLGKIQY
ncbi:hypothetical protein [Enterococcus faecium]|uniref:hypothetical protein n=1 Tax=Enterococcus TaxID=1350 RepID=UPI000CF26353|nr:hypothetical protein [Enterococcus faecium]EGP4999161.1 hypothetical protein [Enterococcus faecium]EGP5096138.1 hypothetical protein [Enterococcus faecium]EGP5644657.1 hypothetical protein [Enterococcus faecium]EME3493764.1 hypothetical protein [Enterococcus faecium]EME7175207.1 hypothetical protein [Enterococcus faecium]